MNEQIKALLDSPNEANQRLGILLGRQNGIYYKDIAKYVLNRGVNVRTLHRHSFIRAIYSKTFFLNIVVGFCCRPLKNEIEINAEFGYKERYSIVHKYTVDSENDTKEKLESRLNVYIDFLSKRIAESFRKP